MRRTRSGTIHMSAPVVVAGALLAATPAPAQGPGAGKRQQIMEARQQLRAVGSKLEKIQAATLKGDRRLRARRDKLQAMIKAAMARQGHDPDEGVKQMKALQTRLRSGKLSDEQKKQTIARLRQKGQALQMVQHRAMQDAKVRKASKAFQSRLEKAMIKNDPKAKKLIQRFKKLSNKLRSLMPRRSRG